MKHPLNKEALDQLFREARTYNAFADRSVSDQVLRELYELMEWGPTSGFDNAKVDAEFFPASRAIERSATEVMPEGRIKSNFLCNLGYGEAKGLHPRLPRLNFEEVCKVI